MSSFSRRQFVATAGLTAIGAVTLKACQPAPPPTTTTPVATTPVIDTPEVTTARLGFIALTDSAPLIIAKEKGFYEKYGMTGVEVLKQASWGVVRDNIVLGSGGGGIDGAHILAPMPYLMSTGTITGGQRLPMYVLARLNTNGQGIVLSKDYLDLNVKIDPTPLKEAFARKRREKEIKIAVTFPGGTHDCWMRYWLSSAGIDPNRDVSMIVVPPPQMVANVKTGTMEAFCVGEPWPLQTVNQELGYGALTTGELWQDHPEKSFTMRADWVDKHPKAAKAILMAVLEAQQWCDKDENKPEMAEILSRREWFRVPKTDILDRSIGKFDFGNGRVLENPELMQKYWRDFASYPYQSHDLWFLVENVRWGYLPRQTDTGALIKAVNREDLWREAAKALGITEVPTSPSRGVERFFDGVEFDPENVEQYLQRLPIKNMREA